jgi:hypothetical protein
MSKVQKMPLGKLGSLTIVPVRAGHEHEPDELQANVDLTAGVVYVREEDWPLIRAELLNLTTRQ